MTTERRLRVMILGCGRTGAMLATRLDDEGHQVTVLDWDAVAFERLPAGFGGETVLGNGVDADVLRMAGVDGADAFVAATNGDNRNIMAGQIARIEFKVPRVVLRIKDPARAGVMEQAGFRVDCRTSAGARLLVELAEREPSEQPV